MADYNFFGEFSPGYYGGVIQDGGVKLYKIVMGRDDRDIHQASRRMGLGTPQYFEADPRSFPAQEGELHPILKEIFATQKGKGSVEVSYKIGRWDDDVTDWIHIDRRGDVYVHGYIQICHRPFSNEGKWYVTWNFSQNTRQDGWKEFRGVEHHVSFEQVLAWLKDFGLQPKTEDKGFTKNYKAFRVL